MKTLGQVNTNQSPEDLDLLCNNILSGQSSYQDDAP